MRLTLFLPFLALLSLFPLLALSHAFPYRRDHPRSRSPPSSVIASRQYRFPRDLLDVCINVNANLLADASQLLGLSSLLGALNLGADVQLCLCLKDLDLYLETNDSIKALVGLLGKNTVGALIKALINTSPEAQHCTFPPHAHHTCNTSDPCHYACDPPYVREGDQCVCAPPHMSCNGVCDIFPQGCSSSAPNAKRGNSIVTIAQAQASCKSGESVCGIAGRETSLSFECIDTSSTKDSCGGCMTRHPFFESHPVHEPSGMDCATIPNAKATACSSSRCVVKSCDDGWVPSLDKKSCIPASGPSSKMLKVRKSSDTVTSFESTTDLSSLVTSVVELVIALNIHGPGTKLIDLTKPSVTDLTNIDSIYNLLNGINAAALGLGSSGSVPLALKYTDSLLDTSSLLLALAKDCNCIQGLGIQSFSDDLNKLNAALLNLQTACKQNPNANLVPSASRTGVVATAAATAATSSTTKPLDSALVVGLTTLLSDLGIHGTSGVIVDNLVGPATAQSVNGLLDTVSLGPANYKRQALPPLTAVANATLGGNSDLLSQVTVVVNLIIKLGDSVDPSSIGTLTSGLAAPPLSAVTPSSVISSTSSLTSSLSTCVIDPILFGTLYRYSVNLANSPDLSSFCQTTGLLYAAECNLRDLFYDCPYMDELGLGNLLAELLLVIDETRYLEAWCNGGSGHATTTIGASSIPSAVPTKTITVTSSAVPATCTTNSAGHSSTSITIASISSVASLPTASVRTSTSASASISSSSSSSSLSHSSATTTSYTTISSPSSVTQTSTSSTTITSSIASTRSTANTVSQSTVTAASPSDTPIVVSLDDVLSDIGLGGTKAVVTVGSGLLGNPTDAAVDNLLNGLGVGPQNVRRSAQNGAERRQLVADVNALVNLGGLGDTINGLVDLVLGLNVVSKALPAAGTLLSPAVPATVPSVNSLPSLDLPSVSGPSSPLIDQGLVNNVLAATLSLLSLSSPTYSQFFQGLGQIVNASSQSMNIIKGCACGSDGNHLDEVYQYLSDIVKATQDLENLCHNQVTSSTSASASAATTAVVTSSSAVQSSSSSDDEPIIVGLTKLLKGLGLDINADVVVDHLLSNNLDHTVNSLLDTLGIGPSGARRRYMRMEGSDW